VNNDCVLVTRNISDFSGLPDLAILNPFQQMRSVFSKWPLLQFTKLTFL